MHFSQTHTHTHTHTHTRWNRTILVLKQKYPYLCPGYFGLDGITVRFHMGSKLEVVHCVLMATVHFLQWKKQQQLLSSWHSFLFLIVYPWPECTIWMKAHKASFYSLCHLAKLHFTHCVIWQSFILLTASPEKTSCTHWITTNSFILLIVYSWLNSTLSAIEA